MSSLANRSRRTIWAVPVLSVAAGILLAIALPALDRELGYELLSERVTGTPAAAQMILTSAITALVSLASIVLTVTLVAIQLAMGQFSPRIVAALMSDRRSQLAMGVFVGSLVYVFLIVREINERLGQVPGISVVVGYALVVVSVVVLILYVRHAANSLRVAGLIDLVGDNLREQIEIRYPERLAGAGDGEDGRVVRAVEGGNLTHVERENLVALARDAGCRLVLVPAMGDYVPSGGPLLRVEGDGARIDKRAAASMIELGAERTHHEDPAYGMRKLVDIAERSVSDPFDDPTTTVQAIDRLYECLLALSQRQFPPGRWTDEAGEVRLEARRIGWDGYVRLAFDELRLAGAGSPQVARRLRAALKDLLAAAPEQRCDPLERQLRLLDAAVEREYEDDEDVEAAGIADVQGIGSGPDVDDSESRDSEQLATGSGRA
jgi:uncharacterized membrane protein